MICHIEENRGKSVARNILICNIFYIVIKSAITVTTIITFIFVNEESYSEDKLSYAEGLMLSLWH